jgi:hypothetical protein
MVGYVFSIPLRRVYEKSAHFSCLHEYDFLTVFLLWTYSVTTILVIRFFPPCVSFVLAVGRRVIEWPFPGWYYLDWNRKQLPSGAGIVYKQVCREHLTPFLISSVCFKHDFLAVDPPFWHMDWRCPWLYCC